MEAIGKFSSLMLLLIAGLAVDGLLFMKIYHWFVQPVFNLPTLSFVHCIGMTIFISLFRSFRKNDSDDGIMEPLMIILAKLFLLLIAWFVSGLI